MSVHDRRTEPEIISWAFHPRIFVSLGAELVTNDFVALIELIKNAYDAFARRVDIRFANEGKAGEQIIEIQDDGLGMDRQTIIASWLMVGTPYKSVEKDVRRGNVKRRVTGEKGLGRLSAARLGGSLSMYTKTADGPCYRIDVDWDDMAKEQDISKCHAEMHRVTPPNGLEKHGTLIRIKKLRKNWDFSETSDLPDLETELARFVPPFQEQSDFRIYLSLLGTELHAVHIEAPKLLSRPTYIVKGAVDEYGVLTVEYKYQREDIKRRAAGKMLLTEAESRLVAESMSSLRDRKIKKIECGPFDFEFRIWDLDKDSLLELNKRFNLGGKVSYVRRLITDSPFNGISLYRDGVLVLPKEIGTNRQRGAAARDWLGLNLRRVSRVGKRFSANQIIGYVNVTADLNPALRDTSDRERLVDNSASREFRNFLFRIIEFVEQEREKDRTESDHQEPPLQDLFAALLSPALPKKLEEIEARKGNWKEIHEAVADHTKEIDAAVAEIRQRFYYYSRLASIGSLAMLLQHEVGNKVAVIEELNKHLRNNFDSIDGAGNFRKKIELSENAVRSLQRLADTFSPLASRTFGTRRRNSVLEDLIKQVVEWHEGEISNSKIKFRMNPQGQTTVTVDPGELIPIIDNLMTNSLYWLRKADSDKRRILVEIFPHEDISRVEIKFHDTGQGVDDGYEEKIFWPGVTKKEGGIGMGLTVASELVAQHNGKMYLIKPGDLGGASFGFDLPLVRKIK